MDAKQHPVFRELTRVKQYFEKIKALETEPEERPMTLDKGAASRFIKHGLVSTNLLYCIEWRLIKFLQAGNDKYDLERAEKQAKERARAQLKAAMFALKSIDATNGQPDSDDDDSEGGVDLATAAEPRVDTNHTEKTEKDSQKKSKGEHKLEDSKAKKERKINTAAMKEKKKERRLKKEEARKARKAQ